MIATPVKMGHPVTVGIHAQYEGLLVVEIPLEPYPDEAWRSIFDHPPGVGISMSMHPPRLIGSSVTIHPPDTEVERYVSHVRERVDAANAEYDKTVRPRLEALERQRIAAEEERRRRIAEAQAKLDELEDSAAA